jgi:MFS family permease
VFAAILSVLMGAVCLIQPGTPPKAGEGAPILEALALMKDVDFAVFIAVSLFVSGMMQFYFLGTAQFMQDKGVSGKGVPAAMAIAQAAQALATLFLLVLFWERLGPKWTLAIGAGSWALLYVVYTFAPSRALIVGSQIFHGLAYVFFIIAGQMFVNEVAPKSIASSAQALIIFVTTGIGLFLGTQAAGIVMDRCKAEEKFRWQSIWTVPLLVVLIGTLLLASPLFRGALPPKDAPKAAAQHEPASRVASADIR